MAVVLHISRDSLGDIEYKIEDNGLIKVTPEPLVRFKISHGQVDNAYIDSNNNIRISGSAIAKCSSNSDEELNKRRKIEQQIKEKVGDSVFDITAALVDGDKLVGYVLRGIDSAISKLTVAATKLYVAIGIVRNARISVNDSGEEALYGIGINLDNLVQIDIKTGKKRTVEKVNSKVVADGVIEIMWEDVIDFTEDMKTRERLDKRSNASAGMRYPSLSVLKRANLSIIVNGLTISLTVDNLNDVLNDSTDSVIITVRNGNNKYKVICRGTNCIEINAYNAAIAGFIGLRKIDRHSEISEVLAEIDADNLWRLFYKKDSVEAVEEEGDGRKLITQSMVRSVINMYSISVNMLSVSVGDEQQERLIRGMKIGKTVVKIMCVGNVYTSEEFIIKHGNTDEFTARFSDVNGEVLDIRFDGLTPEKVKIKNIILICAAAVADKAEIQRISIDAVGRECSYVAEFKSKIRLE